MATYYFDGSDATATDPGGVWTSDDEAFNGDFTTAATASSTGSESSNYLMAEGTNAPITGDTIGAVRAGVFASTGNVGFAYTTVLKVYTDGLAELLGTQNMSGQDSSAGRFGGYIDLREPSGGWTWQKIKNMEFKAYVIGSAVLTKSIFRINIEVYSPSEVIPGGFYMRQGFQ